MAAIPPHHDVSPEGEPQAPKPAEPQRADPGSVLDRLGIDHLSAFTFAMMLVGAGLLLSLALLNTEGSDALPQQGNVGWWLALGAGFLLMLEVLLRLALPRFRVESGVRLIFSIVLLAVGVGGLSQASFIFPVVLAGVGLVVLIRQISTPPLSAETPARADGLSWITFALVLVASGVLWLIAEINSADETAFIRPSRLDGLLPLAVEALLLLEIALRIAIPRYRTGISVRVGLFFVVAAVGVGIKVSLAWLPAILLLGAGVVLLVWLLFRV